MTRKRPDQDIKKAVRDHYGSAIRNRSSCCGPTPQQIDTGGFARSLGYTDSDLSNLPADVSTFGCGNPLALAQIRPGQTVLDLGSGAGLDLILAARKVGPEGHVIGLDMTPDMIEVGKKNLAAAGITNAEIRQGEMENMPVDSASVDWIISNCVINLSPDKKAVFAESFRVLKPGGRVMVSDIVTLDLPDQYRDDITAWVGCLAGAVEQDEYVRLVEEAGFIEVAVVDRLVYDEAGLRSLTCECGCGPDSVDTGESVVERFANRVASIKLTALKPG